MIGGVESASRQPKNEPRINRPKADFARGRPGPPLRIPFEQPLELRRREIRVGHQPRPGSNEIGQPIRPQLLAPTGRPPILPDDRARQWAARCPIPYDCSLALVRYADRRDLRQVETGLDQRPIDDGPDRRPDLIGIVLDMARGRKVLGKFFVCRSENQPIPPDQQGP